jgi:hypothetical protein
MALNAIQFLVTWQMKIGIGFSENRASEVA